MGVGEILVGIFAILVGGMFAFQGGNLIRILFPIVGFFAGFSAGAGLVTAITGDGFLSTLFSWLVGFFVAILFALLAYFFYSFAVVLAFAGLGFSLAAAILSVFNMDWSWLVVIAGTALGALFALFAIVGSLPMMLLIVASSFFGSSMIIYGLMLVFNGASFGDFSNGVVYQTIRNNVGLYILWLTIGITSSITQVRILGEQMKMAQEYWDSSATYDQLFLVEAEKPKKTTKKK
jgi:hypothetical protein